MDKKSARKIIKTATVLMLAAVCIFEPSLLVNASSDTSVITEKFTVLTDIVTAIISGIGVIITLWGISELGLSYQGQDGTMQAHALKRIGGGLIMILAPQILAILV